MQAFENFQKDLLKFTYLMHFDLNKTLYVDFDFNDMKIEVMIYHVIENNNIIIIFQYSAKKNFSQLSFLIDS